MMTVSVEYVRMMAAYNAEANRRIYVSAGRLSDQERRAERGAFWGSIHGTLAHLIWADRQWMSRFDGWAKTERLLQASASDPRQFSELAVERVWMDAEIETWSGRIGQDWLDGELDWWSGAAQRQLSKPLAVLVPHFFNHQTHHRGQVHAMLTAAGERTEDTDLMLIV